MCSLQGSVKRSFKAPTQQGFHPFPWEMISQPKTSHCQDCIPGIVRLDLLLLRFTPFPVTSPCITLSRSSLLGICTLWSSVGLSQPLSLVGWLSWSFPSHCEMPVWAIWFSLNCAWILQKALSRCELKVVLFAVTWSLSLTLYPAAGRAEEQIQNLCQRFLWSWTRVRSDREGGAHLPLHRGRT